MEKNTQITTLLAALRDPPITGGDRLSMYSSMSMFLHENEEKISRTLTDVSLHDLESVILKDIIDSQINVSQPALQTLGLCLHSQHVVNNFCDHDSVISALCDVIVKTTDKLCCTRALWCLSKQNLPENCIKKQLENILKAIEHGQCKKNFQSLTVEYEALCAIIRLLEQVPDDMETHAPRWGKLVYPLVLHDAPKIRQQAMVAMEKGMVAMVKHRDEIIRFLLPDLKPDIKSDPKSKSLLVSQMIRLMSNKLETHVLKVWSLYVRLLGKAIHHGSLINTLLPIVEQGFKNSSPDVKVAAYVAWKELIDNFALSKDILCDQKRIKLLMQVFRINNARNESVALEKLNVWWHFVCQLKDSSSIYFDMVCVPLLHYAINGQINPTGLTPGKTPTRGPSAFKSPATPSGVTTSQTFLAVQHKGCEILAHLLGKTITDPDNPSPMFTTAVPEHDIVTGVAFFTKHHATILDMVKQCLVTLGDQIEDSLLHHVWFATVAHVKNVLQNATKHDSVDVLQCFLQNYQEIIDSQAMAPEKLLKLLEAILCLPPQVLSSSSYSLGGSTIMQGNAAQFLMKCQFHHRILEQEMDNPMFYAVFDKLVTLLFSHDSSSLLSAEKVSDLLELSVSNVEKPDSLAMLWISSVNPLNQLILKTGEINQSGGLEHDFSCILNVLSFPVNHIISSKLSHHCLSQVIKSWTKLCGTFSRLASLVNTIPANTACEELCAKLLPTFTEQKLKDEVFVNALSQLITVIVDGVDFSSLQDPSHFNFATSFSPTKFGQKRESRLHNVSSLVRLTEKLLHAAIHHSEKPEDETLGDTKKPRSQSLSSTFVSLIHALTMLFTHTPSSTMVGSLIDHLTEPMSKLYDAISRKHRRGITQNIGAKAERLWQDVVSSLQGRYTGPYDSDFLDKLAPLLEMTFTHPRQKIKSQTTQLWNATFARGAPLTYPDTLKPVLTKVKDKVAIILPGWNTADIVSIGETPNSMISQAESQVPFPEVVGIVSSPHKPPGSFLSKIVPHSIDDSPLKSPTKIPRSPATKSPKNKSKQKLSLSINDFKDDDFVVIKSSPMKKHVLTSHQKEVLKERSTIPALYSNVDASQDVSLMSKFITTESQMSMSNFSTPSSTPTPVLEITPFPFSKEARKKAEEKSAMVVNAKVKDIMDSSETNGPSRRRSVRFALKSADVMEKENFNDTDKMEDEEQSGGSVTMVAASEDDVSMAKKELSKGVIEICDTQSPSTCQGENCENVIMVSECTGSLDKSSGISDKSTSDVFSVSSQFLMTDKEIMSAKEPVASESPRRTRRSLKGKQPSDGESPARKTRTMKDGSKGKPNSQDLNQGREGTKKLRRSSLLDNITSCEVVPEKVTRQTSLLILAEESQQVSPKKMMIVSDKIDNVIVEETPAKEDDVVLSGNVNSCSKNLFDEQDSHIIPDSQPEPKLKTLVPYSETQNSGNSELLQLMSSLESPFEEVKTEVDLTPPRSQQPQLEQGSALSPVVAMHRMSHKEVLTYSPVISSFTKLREVSQVEDKPEGSVGKRRRCRPRNKDRQVGDDGKTASRTSSSESLSQEVPSSQPLRRSSRERPPSLEKPAVESQKIGNQNKLTQTVTGMDEENVFIVEMHSAEGSKEPCSNCDMDIDLTEDTPTTQCTPSTKNDNLIGQKSPVSPVTQSAQKQSVNASSESDASMSTAANNPDIEPMDCDSMDLSAKPRSSRNRKQPQWLTDMDLTGSGKKRKQSLSDSDSQGDGSQLGKHSRQRSRATLAALQENSPNTETNEPLKPTPEFILDPQSTMAGEVPTFSSDENNEPTVLGEKILASKDLLETDVTQDDSAGDKSHDTMSKVTEENLDVSNSETQDLKDVATQDKTPPPGQDTTVRCNGEISQEAGGPVAEASTPSSKESRSKIAKKRSATVKKCLSAEQLNSLFDGHNGDSSDEETLESVRKTLKDSQVALLEASLVTSQESEGFEITVDNVTEDEPVVACEPNSKGPEDETKVQDISKLSSDSEPLVKLKTSTPVGKKSRMSLSKRTKGKSRSPRNSLRLMSPINRTLRSSGVSNLRTKALNRSVDSARWMQDKKKKLRRKKVTKDDSDLKHEQEVETGHVINDNQCDIGSGSEQCMDKVNEHTEGGAVIDDALSGSGECEAGTGECEAWSGECEAGSGECVMDGAPLGSAVVDGQEPDLTQSEFMKVLDNRNMKIKNPRLPTKFVSPLRSPPRRGKLFNIGETPPSHKIQPLYSRASLILQRAKMPKPSPQSLQRGRGPLVPSARGGRPGILKSPLNESPSRPGVIKLTRQSPPHTAFRPLHVPRIFSPSASPSASILRKRKLSGDFPVDSPSPPNKQRRVCFNDNIETREIPSAQKVNKSKARMVGRGSPKPVNRCLDMPPQGTLVPSPLVNQGESKTSNKEEKFITTTISKGHVIDIKDQSEQECDSELSESQGSIQVTPESQLDCKRAICPKYINCDIHVEQVLHQLTSSMWSAGLSQLVRSMNITTIGHLSALTEQEVHNLPIKSPKVQTVRDIIHMVAGPKMDAEENKMEEENPLPPSKVQQTLQLSDLSPSKDPNISIESSEVFDPALESRDLLDEIRQLDNSLKSTPPSSPEPEIPPRRSQLGLLDMSSLIVKKCDRESLQRLPSAQLLQLFTQLNGAIANVVVALKDKCPTSPNSSQS